MKTKIISINIVLVYSLLFSSLGFGESQKGDIRDMRVYCRYIPKRAGGDKLTLSQLLATKTYERLKDSGTDVTIKAEWIDEMKAFVLTAEKLAEINKDCEKQVGSKGDMLDILGTDAWYYEILTKFYPVIDASIASGKTETDWAADWDAALVALFDQGELSQEQVATFANTFAEQRDKLEASAQKLLTSNNAEASLLRKALSGIKGVADNPTAQKALVVAGALALNYFGPTMVALGVQALYPYVYSALWGLPSTWNVAGIALFNASRFHAMMWAYNNTDLFVKALTTIYGLGQAAAKLTSKFTKKDVEAGIDLID